MHVAHNIEHNPQMATRSRSQSHLAIITNAMVQDDTATLSFSTSSPGHAAPGTPHKPRRWRQQGTAAKVIMEAQVQQCPPLFGLGSTMLVSVAKQMTPLTTPPLLSSLKVLTVGPSSCTALLVSHSLFVLPLQLPGPKSHLPTTYIAAKPINPTTRCQAR